jgi:uncharacterized protein
MTDTGSASAFSVFLEETPEGIFVDQAKLNANHEMAQLVTRIFTSGACFEGLDYACFSRLLYQFSAPATGRVRLADRIRDLPETRRPLYRAVSVRHGQAEYIFEPVFLEAQDPTADSEPEPTQLDFDELVAELWIRGVRYGLDEAVIRQAIQSGKTERVIIARPLAPTPGVDAGIEEQTSELRPDNAPRLLPDGRVNLRQFQNRFPQMQEGTLLIKKVPRRPGASGFTIDGTLQLAPTPRDFDLSSLAGPGTRVITTAKGEFIAAACNGFLNIDSKTNQFSITDKIINRAGVAVRTTGDLSLAGDRYEEFGDVQERRKVEGRDLVFHGDVFGHVLSQGGLIQIDQNLVGGSAVNQSGDIEIAGLASAAKILADAGEIRLQRAENCLIRGRRVVVVDWAANCTILAESVGIRQMTACTVGAQSIHIHETRGRSHHEVVISIVPPNLAKLDADIAELEQQGAACTDTLTTLTQEIATLGQLPDMQRYLALATRIEKREIVLSASQQADWQRLSERALPIRQQLEKLRASANTLKTRLEEIRLAVAGSQAQKKLETERTGCQIDAIHGDTQVRLLAEPANKAALAQLDAKALAAHLHRASGKILFAGHQGGFSTDSRR